MLSPRGMAIGDTVEDKQLYSIGVGDNELIRASLKCCSMSGGVWFLASPLFIQCRWPSVSCRNEFNEACRLPRVTIYRVQGVFQLVKDITRISRSSLTRKHVRGKLRYAYSPFKLRPVRRTYVPNP